MYEFYPNPINCQQPMRLALPLLFFSFQLSFGICFAQSYQFSGTVTDQAGNALAYASLSFNQARYGTITDEEGRFALNLPSGDYRIRISYLGHEVQYDRITLNGSYSKDYQLKKEELLLEQVVITSDERDPAYGIIQLAIDNKKNNALPFQAYGYQAYTKTVMKFQDGYDPDSLMQLQNIFGGRNKKSEDTLEAPPELKSGLLYLSENVSKVSVAKPDKFKENILSSKVSGQADEFSFFGSWVNSFTPYENRLVLDEVAKRGIISPISDQAFFFYKYQLLGTVRGEGYEAYKIRIMPKRKSDPVYRGIIYIADSSYAVQELDIYTTRQQQLNILDTLAVHQEYQLIKGKWLPLQTRQSFAMQFNIFGIRIPLAGYSQTLVSDYELDPAFDKKFFNQEIIAIADSALDQDSNFWANVRPIPLNQVEVRDYSFKDSLEQIRNSPEYLDSLTREGRKIGVMDILLNGKTFYNYRTKKRWTIESLIGTAGYNPMEGWYVAPSLSYGKEISEGKFLNISGTLRYGFSDKVFGGRMNVNMFDRSKGSWRFSAGRYPAQFSRFEQISPGLNTFYTLFNKINYLKLYRKNYAEFSMGKEVANGLFLSSNLRYEFREGMENTDDFTLFKANDDRTYSPNITFDDHHAAILGLQLSFRPFNKYMSTPKGKISMGSDWPRIILNYQTTLGSPGERSSEFSSIRLDLTKDLGLGMLGNSKFRISTGRFLSDSNVEFPDFAHFRGNETDVRSRRFDQFGLMPYYKFSTTNPYVEGHWEHDFAGFILNKIPLIKKLRLNEFAGLHYLITEDQTPYLELNVGLQKNLFKVLPLRIDLNVRLLGDAGDKLGYKLVSP